MSELKCDICRESIPLGSQNRIAGHDICDLCRRGDIATRVAIRGWSLEANEKFFHGNSGEELCEVRLKGVLPRPIVIEGKFSKERLEHKLGKVFFKELQVGEDTFDKGVYIRTKTPEKTKVFLEIPAVQGAILELVNMGWGTSNANIRIKDGELHVRTVSEGMNSALESQVLSCILLHHLEEFTKADESENSPYR